VYCKATNVCAVHCPPSKFNKNCPRHFPKAHNLVKSKPVFSIMLCLFLSRDYHGDKLELSKDSVI